MPALSGRKVYNGGYLLSVPTVTDAKIHFSPKILLIVKLIIENWGACVKAVFRGLMEY
jgi:hypothetical protein